MTLILPLKRKDIIVVVVSVQMIENSIADTLYIGENLRRLIRKSNLHIASIKITEL